MNSETFTTSSPDATVQRTSASGSPSTVPTPSPMRPSDSMSDTYISSLSPKEYKAYLIAKSHLEMSFDVEKSIGYKQFTLNSDRK
jgi:hypothetical protein